MKGTMKSGYDMLESLRNSNESTCAIRLKSPVSLSSQQLSAKLCNVLNCRIGHDAEQIYLMSPAQPLLVNQRAMSLAAQFSGVQQDGISANLTLRSDGSCLYTPASSNSFLNSTSFLEDVILLQLLTQATLV